MAQPGTKGRKKSVVSFSSEDTKTIEYEDGSGNASTEVDKFDEDKVPSPGIENASIEKNPHADCIQCLPCNTLDEIFLNI